MGAANFLIRKLDHGAMEGRIIQEMDRLHVEDQNVFQKLIEDAF